MSLLIRNARVLTLAGDTRPRRGAALRELGVIDRGDVLVDGGTDRSRRAKLDAPEGPEIIDANGPGADAGFHRLPHAGLLGG